MDREEVNALYDTATDSLLDEIELITTHIAKLNMGPLTIPVMNEIGFRLERLGQLNQQVQAAFLPPAGTKVIPPPPTPKEINDALWSNLGWVTLRLFGGLLAIAVFVTAFVITYGILASSFLNYPAPR